MAASLFLVLAVSSIATADIYIWTGGTMNFSDSKNWQGGLAPSVPSQGGPDMCSTAFGVAGKSIISQLDVSTDFVQVIPLLRLCVVRHSLELTLGHHVQRGQTTPHLALGAPAPHAGGHASGI